MEARISKPRVLLSLFLLLIWLLTNSEIASAKIYYVAMTGSNSNFGTESRPFRTIQKAANVVNPGDTVLVRGGSYVEQINIKTSGTASSKITFKPEPGTGTVFLKHPTTSPPADKAVFELFNAGYNRIEGFHFKDSLANQAIKMFDTNKDVDFETVPTRVRSNEVVNNIFENIGNSLEGAHFIILVTRGQDILIENNKFMKSYGHMIKLTTAYRVVVRGNTVRNLRGALHPWSRRPIAIGVRYGWGPSYEPGLLANGYHHIVDNYFDGFDGNGTSTGIRCDGRGHDTTIRANIVQGLGKGIFLESLCYYNTVQENIAYNNEHGFYTSGTTIGATKWGLWINNVAYNNANYGFALKHVEDSTFKNNIAFNNGIAQVLTTEQAVGVGNVWENNLWYSSSNSKVAIWNCELNEWPRGSGRLVDGNCMSNVNGYATPYQITFAEWVYLSGETGALSVDPQFVGTTAGSEDFHLKSSSPARGSGENGVDMGAYPQGDGVSNSPLQPPTEFRIKD